VKEKSVAEPKQEAKLPENKAAAAPKRNPRFFRSLIDKLPKLAAPTRSVKDNFRIDEEWSSLGNLRADAVLGPLEKIAPERLR
jgi:hypothetical protein